ncbi:hypothetical protein BGW38_002782 [Lunasporangiospora selenospora]|uniref:RING-type E3 ubiquitin transferase n=1 Tax=Lunasporangiospora selenospora TaxID=979761 RepID=A0A9P6KHS4_9FUNG|nr:hypothetical protein BGW38_002782 [Lunasporangiospora selenospora]
MPEVIPTWVLFIRVLDIVGAGVLLILRAVLVASIWLVILPYFTIWMWRLYFWIGDWFAFTANGIAVPPKEITGLNAINATADPAALAKALEQLDSFTRFVYGSVPSDKEWLRAFILDCSEGFTISVVVLVVFVALFLLREWVLQNQDLDAVRPRGPDINDNQIHDADMALLLDRIRAEPIIQQAMEAQRVMNNANRPMENQPNNRFRPLAQHLDDEDAINNLHAWAMPEEDVEPIRRNPYARLGQGGPALGVDAGSSFAAETRDPQWLQDLNASSHPTSQTGASGFSYASLSADSSSAGASSGSMGDSGNSVSVKDILQFMDDTSVDGGGSSSKFGQAFHGSIPLRTPNKDIIYWRPGVALTLNNAFLRQDGSPMSYLEEESRYQEIILLANLDREGISKLQDARHANTEKRQVKEIEDEEEIRRSFQPAYPGAAFGWSRTTRAPDSDATILPLAVDPQPRPQAPAFGLVPQQRLAPPPPPTQVPFQPARPAQPARPIQPAPAVRPAAPVPAPAPAPVQPADVVDPDDDLDDMNAEELDGIWEVIGMRGSYWLLLQSSLLMSALVCASLGIGIWIPYMFGKTTLLMNPLNILRVPLRILSKLTDPAIDFFIDRIVPTLMGIVCKPVKMFWDRVTPLVQPVVGSFLGGKTLSPALETVQEYLLPVWNTLTQGGYTVGILHQVQESIVANKTDTQVIDALIDSGVDNVVNGTSFHGMDAFLQPVLIKWNQLAFGTTSSDKLVAISIGYAMMFVISAWYMRRVRNGHYNLTVGRLVRDLLHQLSLILKIAFFVAIEMVVFPLFCGIVVGVTTLPVLPGATIASRWAFYQQSPNWSIIMHWLVGTAFMFNFSMFVSICRGVVRPGVMWFIRDPNDEGFHPVREMLERPVLMQLRKLGTGALMYLTLIVLGISVTTHGVHWCIRSVFPLRWRIDEPLSDLPFDMLLFHLAVPLTFRWINPSSRFEALFIGWWRKLAQWMRLSSFMYGKDGERYPEEEGRIVHRTWKAWLLRYRPPIPSIDGADGEDAGAIGSGEDLDLNNEAPVLFVRDGGLFRVPNRDRVVYLKDRRVLVPVDTEGRALDPKEDQPGEIDPMMEIQPRGGRDAVRVPIDPKEGTVIVYTPPNFKRRLILFIVIIWTSTMAFLMLSIVAPLIIGRALLTRVTEREVHDVYSFVIGVYSISILWYVQELALGVYRLLQPKYETEAPATATEARDEAEVEIAELEPEAAVAARPTTWGTVYNWVVNGAKLLYIGAFLGIVLPLSLGLLMELYMLVPLRAALFKQTGIILAMCWAVGLIYMRLIYQILQVIPNNEYAVYLNRVFPSENVEEWDVKLATTKFVLPGIVATIAAVGSPPIVAYGATWILGLEGSARSTLFRLSYPWLLVTCILAYVVKESTVLFKGWRQYVRDQEYLMGHQLHNLTEEQEENRNQNELTTESKSPVTSKTNEPQQEDDDEAEMYEKQQTRYARWSEMSAAHGESSSTMTTRSAAAGSVGTRRGSADAKGKGLATRWENELDDEDELSELPELEPVEEGEDFGLRSSRLASSSKSTSYHETYSFRSSDYPQTRSHTSRVAASGGNSNGNGASSGNLWMGSTDNYGSRASKTTYGQMDEAEEDGDDHYVTEEEEEEDDEEEEEEAEARHYLAEQAEWKASSGRRSETLSSEEDSESERYMTFTERMNR